MNDEELVASWAVLEPSARRRARIETRVFDWIEASESSLFAEWFGLLRTAPATGLVYVAVGALSLMLLTPLGLVTSLIVG